jgi:hypothetical protein
MPPPPPPPPRTSPIMLVISYCEHGALSTLYVLGPHCCLYTEHTCVLGPHCCTCTLSHLFRCTTSNHGHPHRRASAAAAAVWLGVGLGLGLRGYGVILLTAARSTLHGMLLLLTDSDALYPSNHARQVIVLSIARRDHTGISVQAPLKPFQCMTSSCAGSAQTILRSQTWIG